MELTEKTFIERLQHVQTELRTIAQSSELRLLLQNSNYDPERTIMDALHAVSEVVDAYQCKEISRLFKMPRLPLSPENGYYPVVDYLNSLARADRQPNLEFLDNLALRYFGTNEPLHNLYLKKTLIAAVARVKNPGCNVHTCTVLTGEPGNGKTSFWRCLFGKEWFTSQLGSIDEKDAMSQLHHFWCLEWSEFETIYKYKDVSYLRNFMTSTVDTWRVPYSRLLKQHARRCILVGSTNEPEIISNPTESRRFWFIPTSGIIPVEQLEQERDQIWASANALYESGENWYLDAAEIDSQRIKS